MEWDPREVGGYDGCAVMMPMTFLYLTRLKDLRLDGEYGGGWGGVSCSYVMFMVRRTPRTGQVGVIYPSLEVIGKRIA